MIMTLLHIDTADEAGMSSWGEMNGIWDLSYKSLNCAVVIGTPIWAKTSLSDISTRRA